MQDLIEIIHPSCSNLRFLTEYVKESPESGESNYSLGTPPSKSHYSIKRVFWGDTEITTFIDDFCAPLYEKWEEEIN